MASAPTFRIDLDLPPATVRALLNGGYSLYAMFAVAMNNAAARPTVALVIKDLMPAIAMEWSADVAAFTSSSPIVEGRIVRPGYAVPIDPGQTLRIKAGGAGHVQNGGAPGKITLLNETDSALTVGFAHPASGENAPRPIYAVPLYGRQANVAAPLPKCLLVFTTETIPPGAVLEKAIPLSGRGGSSSQAVLVTADEGARRKLTFDINTSWDWGDFSWAQILPADADLVTALIERD